MLTRLAQSAQCQVGETEGPDVWRYPPRMGAFLMSTAVVMAGLTGCAEVTAEPTPAATESAAEHAARLEERSAALRAYLQENFGGGYGQPPVSWYSSVKSVTFVDDDHLVVQTSLTLNDGAAVHSLATALRYYSDLPAKVEVLAGDGEVLVE